MQPLNTMEHPLDSNEVIALMQEMGFLPENPKVEYDSQVTDIYNLLRTNAHSEILADHLMTVLMCVQGIDHREKVCVDGPAAHWADCGLFDEERGTFVLRKGETKIVQKHFDLLMVTRMQLKKTMKKPDLDEPAFKPTISSATQRMAD